MANFILEANIARYKDLLATEMDARKIAMLISCWPKKRPSLPTGVLEIQIRGRQNNVS